MHALKRGHVTTQQEGGCLQARKTALTRHRTLLGIDLGLSSFQNWEKIDFYCLSHAVCGILLWQHKQTNIDVFTSETQNKQMKNKPSKTEHDR